MVSGGRPHGTTQEAGYDVGQSGGRPHGTICKTEMWRNTFLWHFLSLSRVPAVENHKTGGRVRFKGGYRV